MPSALFDHVEKYLWNGCTFTRCGICGIFAVTLIWIVQNYLQLLVCQVVSTIAIPFCMVSPTLTSQGFSRVQNQLARLVTKSPPFTRSLPLLHSLHWLPVWFRILFKINFLTYKTLCEKQPAIFTPCLPHPFHPVHWDQTMIVVCQSLGSRPTQVQDLFTLVPHLFGTTFHCLSFQPVQLLPSGNFWRHVSLTWSFLHRHWHVQWPVDVTEMFLQICCWTLIRLSHHWAWLRRGYWRCRPLIDWLIDWLIEWSFNKISKQCHYLVPRH